MSLQPTQIAHCENPVARESRILELLGPEREVVDPVTGICTWKAIAIDRFIDGMPMLYKGQHQAEAYHAGNKGQYLDHAWKRYLAEKYPLMDEYKPWKMGRSLDWLLEVAFETAYKREEEEALERAREVKVYEEICARGKAAKAHTQARRTLSTQSSNRTDWPRTRPSKGHPRMSVQQRQTFPHSLQTYAPVQDVGDLIFFDEPVPEEKKEEPSLPHTYKPSEYW